ncbi:matrin-3-like, partial [Saccostrea cucullata]|uniref:matrin-3-like n=1 Tax=Saccostrea cuccullata TaxID=36930 RepID=UPI002ED58EEF
DKEITETKSPEKTKTSEKSTDDSEKKEKESSANKDGDLSVNQEGLSNKKSDSHTSSSENERSSQADLKATKSDRGKPTKKEESSKEIDTKKKPSTTPARKTAEVEKKTPEGMEGITSKEGPSKGAASKIEGDKEKTNKSMEFRIPKLSSARKTVDGKEKGSGGMDFKIPKRSSTSPARKTADVEQQPAETRGDMPPVSDNLATKQKRDTSVQKVEDSTNTPSSSSVKEVPQQTSEKTPSLQAKPDPPVTKESASEIPPYSSDVPIGQNYIVPVTGFYCKLCSKFYNNEKAAKESHCQTRAHYDKYKSAMIGLKTPVGGVTKSAEKGEDQSASSIVMKDESKSGVESLQTDPEGSTRGRAGSHANRGRRGRK